MKIIFFSLILLGVSISSHAQQARYDSEYGIGITDDKLPSKVIAGKVDSIKKFLYFGEEWELEIPYFYTGDSGDTPPEKQLKTKPQVYSPYDKNDAIWNEKLGKLHFKKSDSIVKIMRAKDSKILCTVEPFNPKDTIHQKIALGKSKFSFICKADNVQTGDTVQVTLSFENHNWALENGIIELGNDIVREGLNVKGGEPLTTEFSVPASLGEKTLSVRGDFKHDFFGFDNAIVKDTKLIVVSKKEGVWAWVVALPWYFMLLLFFAVALVIAIPILVFLLKYKKNINGNEDLNRNDYGEANNDEEPGNNEDPTIEFSSDAQTNDISAIDDVLNAIIPNIDGLATQEKIDFIKGKISSSDKMSTDLLMYYQELNLSDDSTPGDFLNKLKALKQDIDELKKKLEKCPEDIYAQVISLLLSKDSKTLSSLVDKAKQESTGVSQTNYDILKRFINILSMNLKESVKSNAVVQNVDLDITEQQMAIATNRRKMMVWMIEQLEAKGYKELNRNGSIDDNFKKLTQELLSVSEIEAKPSIEEIINTAVNNDQFTLEQKNILLKRIIERINSQINDETAVISSSISIDNFISMVSEKIQSPNSYEEAQTVVRENNLKLINEVLDSNIDDLTQQSFVTALRSAIVKLLSRHLKGLNAENLEDIINELSISLTKSAILTKTLNDYNINSINELPMIIRQKLSEEIIASVNHKVNQFFPDKHFDSAQKLVNALLKLSEDFKDNEALIADELEEKIMMRNNSYVSSGESSIIKLLNDYNELVSMHEEQLITDIKVKTEHITRLESKVESTQEEVNTLTQKNTVLMTESEKMLENLRSCAERIIDSCKTILHPCSEGDESQCIDIEDRLFADLLNSSNRIKAIHISNESIPVDTRKTIQQILIQELVAENSPINTVCRYYAYSRLPFMTDTSREYGITFSRKNMSELFYAIETLYIQFGINLSIPDLFVAGFEEGNFENLTGQTYGDLDNLCQNSRNHFDNIDSKVKPSNVIVDVIKVGYTVDGKVERITSVLTY